VFALERTVATRSSKAPLGLWLHVYGIMPPHPRKLLRKLASLLDTEDRVARRAGRPWTGGLISETKDGPVTHVVIVTDTVSRQGLINLAVEAELKQLAADVFIGLPTPVQRAVHAV
jgi:hypothetical protein